MTHARSNALKNVPLLHSSAKLVILGYLNMFFNPLIASLISIGYNYPTENPAGYCMMNVTSVAALDVVAQDA